MDEIANDRHQGRVRMDIIWDGVVRSDSLHREALQIRRALADAARSYDWPRVLEPLSRDRDLVNVTRPGGSSLFSPLHQAAHGDAPIEVVQELIRLGAWRTLRTARGERPVDLAKRLGHHHLLEVLTPELKHDVPLAVLQRIQAHFHEVIRGRIDRPLPNHGLRLPELEPLLELERPEMWFPVPGMYGGFSYRLDCAGAEARLVSESWCRVVGGSGQRHEITPTGSRLVEEGFV